MSSRGMPRARSPMGPWERVRTRAQARPRTASTANVSSWSGSGHMSQLICADCRVLNTASGARPARTVAEASSQARSTRRGSRARTTAAPCAGSASTANSCSRQAASISAA